MQGGGGIWDPDGALPPGYNRRGPATDALQELVGVLGCRGARASKGSQWDVCWCALSPTSSARAARAQLAEGGCRLVVRRLTHTARMEYLADDPQRLRQLLARRLAVDEPLLRGEILAGLGACLQGVGELQAALRPMTGKVWCGRCMWRRPSTMCHPCCLLYELS